MSEKGHSCAIINIKTVCLQFLKEVSYFDIKSNQIDSPNSQKAPFFSVFFNRGKIIINTFCS